MKLLLLKNVQLNYACFMFFYCTFYNFNSLAILEAMFLKAMDVPDIRLKRTPLSERRGNLQTSISHWTRLSAWPSPWTQSSKKRSRCS